MNFTGKEAIHCSLVERPLIVRWFVRSFLRGVLGARCSSVVRAFAHGAMGHRIDHSWGGPIELFLVPAGVTKGRGMCYPVCGKE